MFFRFFKKKPSRPVLSDVFVNEKGQLNKYDSRHVYTGVYRATATDGQLYFSFQTLVTRLFALMLKYILEQRNKRL